MMERNQTFAIFGLLILSFSIPTPILGETVTITVTEDTWIDGLTSQTIRGDDQRLGICPAAYYWIYLKFDLTAIEGTIESAVLQITRVDGHRPEEIALYAINDDGWSEATLNGPSRPEPFSPAPETAIAFGKETSLHDHWLSSSLTALIQSEQKGDGILSLMLREDPGNPVDVRHYFSREGALVAGVQAPTLVLEVQPTAPVETINPEWETVEIGVGVKPAFDFDANNRIHIMGMTEIMNGEVWYAVADSINGPWNPQTVSTSYFYGPGDLRATPSGSAHIAVHDHYMQNARHIEIKPDGTPIVRIIETPNSHDGWDNSLAVDDAGNLHTSSVYPIAFGAFNCLQYGVFDGNEWTVEQSIPNSGAFMYGLNTSIAIDRNGNPHIAYCKATDWTSLGSLNYTTKQNGQWQITTVVTDGIRGRFPSLALDHWDRPHIVWLDVDPDDTQQGTVRYGVLNGDTWDIETIDTLHDLDLSFGGARKSVSLALDSNYRPHVAYADRRTIKYAVKQFIEWDIATLLETDTELYKGLVVLRLDTQNIPGIVFWQSAEGIPGLIRFARPQGTAVKRWMLDG